MLQKLLLTSVLLTLTSTVIAQETVRSTLGAAGSSSTVNASGKKYIVQESVGQASVIGRYSAQSNSVLQGFIQPPITVIQKDTATDNTLSAVVYPNPFKSLIQIRFTEAISAKVNVTLYDITGRLVYTNELAPAKEIQLNFDFLRSESYLLNVQSGNKIFTTTIIKN